MCSTGRFVKILIAGHRYPGEVRTNILKPEIGAYFPWFVLSTLMYRVPAWSP